jgi:hypothetical protein
MLRGNLANIVAVTEGRDYWKFTDIVTQSQMLFLEKKDYFQGTEIQLSNLVKDCDVGMLTHWTHFKVS